MPLTSLLNQLPFLEMSGKHPTPSKPHIPPSRLDKRDKQNNDIENSGASHIRSRIKGHTSATQMLSSSHDDSGDRLPLLKSNSFDSDDSHSSPAAPKTSRMARSVSWAKLLVATTLLTHLCYNAPGITLETAFYPAHGYTWNGGLKPLIFTPKFEYVPSSSQASVFHIPRIVHVTYKSMEKLPLEWQQSIEHWKKTHPDWELRFWSDNDIYEFVHNEYPEMEALHKSYKFMIQRVDSVRYMILHKYGGVYSDMDIFPATTLDKLLQQWEDAGKQVLLAETSNMGVTNAFMASAPQSSFMKCVVDNLPNYQHSFQHWIHWNHWEILSSAGSAYLWGMVGHCDEERDQVQIMAAASFRGCSVCSGQQGCDTEWLHHSSTNSSWHNHTSWHAKLMFAVTYSYLCHPFRACFVTVLIMLIMVRNRKVILKRLRNTK